MTYVFYIAHSHSMPFNWYFIISISLTCLGSCGLPRTRACSSAPFTRFPSFPHPLPPWRCCGEEKVTLRRKIRCRQFRRKVNEIKMMKCQTWQLRFWSIFIKMCACLRSFRNKSSDFDRTVSFKDFLNQHTWVQMGKNTMSQNMCCSDLRNLPCSKKFTKIERELVILPKCVYGLRIYIKNWANQRRFRDADLTWIKWENGGCTKKRRVLYVSNFFAVNTHSAHLLSIALNEAVVVIK